MLDLKKPSEPYVDSARPAYGEAMPRLPRTKRPYRLNEDGATIVG